MKTTFETVQETLAMKYSLPLESIQAESTLESLKLDSLDLIEMLFEVEDQFHIRIPQGRREDVNIVTVQDIVNIVNKLVAQQRPTQLAGGHPS